MATIQFIHEDVKQILSEIKESYELATSRVLVDADVEMLLLNAMAYRETILRSGINHTGRQNLLAFATGPALDFIGQFLDVVRLQPSSATCTIRFTLVDGHLGTVIPEGARVQTVDGKVIFATTTALTVLAGTNTVQVDAECLTLGTAGNGYAVNTAIVIVNPIAFVQSATNITVTTGGADVETDDAYRKRIQLAPSKFSTAGSVDSYRYHALTANQAIVDVAIMSSTPGTVQVYPLLQNGLLPTTSVLNEVAAVLNDKKVRPLTDTVSVFAPTVTPYTIDVELTLYNGQNAVEVQQLVTEALTNYLDQRKNKLGVDVVPSQISAVCLLPNRVYKCTVVQPAADVVVNNNVYTQCTNTTVTVTGFANG